MDPNMQQLIVPGDMSASIILASMAATATDVGFWRDPPVAPNSPSRGKGRDALSADATEEIVGQGRCGHQRHPEDGVSITHACGNFHSPNGCSLGYLIAVSSAYFR